MRRGLMQLSTFDRCHDFLFGPMPRMSGGMSCIAPLCNSVVVSILKMLTIDMQYTSLQGCVLLLKVAQAVETPCLTSRVLVMCNAARI